MNGTLRVRSLVGAVVLLASQMVMGAGSTTGSPNLSGVWLPTKEITTVRTVEGTLPPLRPKAAAEYDRRIAARKAGKPLPDSTTYCQPDGVPRLMYAMMPFQILQKPDQITFVHEKGHIFRLIRMNEPVVEDQDPTYLGYSTGVWHGRDLVVTTVGFNDSTTLDRAGLPHSDMMRVMEVYSLERGGKRLSLRITVDDPVDYKTRWTTTLEFRRLNGYRIKENVCELTNPDFKSYYVEQP